jgi:predicted mannosyl-3-phosphoglycerate phosphatase (HAD superfamily)
MDGKKVSFNQKINYFGRKSSFLTIVEKESQMIDQLILENLKRPHVYNNINWVRLQAALEARQEYLLKIIKTGQPNVQSAERQFLRRQGLGTIIFGTLFLAVLALLKGTRQAESNLIS